MEQLILVDQEDNAIGSADKITVHQNALCHRAFSVFIFRGTGEQQELLLQQRHPQKYHCGGLWTNTCCGHPRVDEAIDQAASRRLYEEMGLVLPLHYRDKFHYIAHFSNGLTENEVDSVFVGYYHHELIIPAVDEVANHHWMLVSDVIVALDNNPEQYTPWFKQALALALAN